jgi:hypothetical protein
VADLPFCPKCGHNSATAVGDSPTADDASITSGMAAAQRYFDRGPRGNAIVVGALIIGVGLVILGVLTRSQTGAAPGAGGEVVPGASPSGQPALIVGLTIQSPVDGQAIATKDVTVIGLAPPGLSVTRDVSFGLDQHATADSTGHWAIVVGLNNGENKLKFRIGDDHSTEHEIRVTYTPPAQ